MKPNRFLQADFATALKLVNDCGYHRRDEEAAAYCAIHGLEAVATLLV